MRLNRLETERVEAIDFHIHVIPLEMFKPGVRAVFKKIMHKGLDFEKYRAITRDPSKLVEMLEGVGVKRAVVVTYTCKEVMGFSEDIVKYVSSYCGEYPDVLNPFSSPDLRGGDLAQRLEEMVSKYGIKGLKIHPVHQLIYPNAYHAEEGVHELEKLYAKAEDLNLPVMIHTGTSIFPGARIKYGNPLCLDDIAVDFPDLKIIMAHGGRPIWMDTSFYLVRRHRNVFLEISSIPPKSLLNYFPRLEEISDKTLFGSDWPGASIGKNLTDLLKQPLSERAKRQIVRENALKILK